MTTERSIDLTIQANPDTTCNTELAQSPWNFDVPLSLPPTYGPGASQSDTAPASTPRQGLIPQQYRDASLEELSDRIEAARKELSKDLLILGHFYQRDEIVRHADFLGDSYQLSRQALESEAQHIVFCGVHFMAETADMLTRPEQSVTLPNLAAGCSMADMADTPSVEACWQQLQEIFTSTNSKHHANSSHNQSKLPIIPVTYINSSAELKAFCGKHNGIVCTSANAPDILEWAFQRGERVLFFPDQHLGRNTARGMNISLDQMPLWDPAHSLGGSTVDEIVNSKVVLWKGWCSVHKRFTVDQIAKARIEYPDVKVLVHSECTMEVVDAADGHGSTNFILNEIRSAKAGQTFAIGTEVNMVNRLAAQFPHLTIFCLDPIICPCSTMYRIHPAYLAWVTEALVNGDVVNQVRVRDDIAFHARVALQRMLEVAQ